LSVCHELAELAATEPPVVHVATEFVDEHKIVVVGCLLDTRTS